MRTLSIMEFKGKDNSTYLDDLRASMCHYYQNYQLYYPRNLYYAVGRYHDARRPRGTICISTLYKVSPSAHLFCFLRTSILARFEPFIYKFSYAPKNVHSHSLLPTHILILQHAVHAHLASIPINNSTVHKPPYQYFQRRRS